MSGSRRRPGCLGPFVDGYRTHLLGLGYTPGTVRGMLKVLGQLGRWMETEEVNPGELQTGDIEPFLAARRAEGTRRSVTRGELGQLLVFLGSAGAMRDEAPREPTPIENLAQDYRNWLVSTRGLAEVIQGVRFIDGEAQALAG